MAMAERRNLLVDFVNSEGSVTFAQIKQQFPDVSDMTLRTDLKALDQQGEIIRVHGGATSVGFAVGASVGAGVGFAGAMSRRWRIYHPPVSMIRISSTRASRPRA